MSLKRFWKVSYVSAAIAIGALCACSLIADTDNDQCTTTADCVKRGPQFAGLVCSGGVCVSEGGCTTNAECIDANLGKPFICNKATRACVNLQTDLASDAGGTAPAPCTPYASPEDLRNDDTVWLGAILDTKGPFGAQSGAGYVAMMDLARREISRNGGLPGATVGAKARPLAFVHCEMNGDPGQAVSAADYLVKQAGFQLFIAGDTATTAVPMVTQVLLPNRAINFGLQSGAVADIPTGTPPLFYPMQADLTYSANTYPAMIPFLEERARARFNLAPSDNIRIAYVYNNNPLFQAVAQGIAKNIRFNGGKTAVENGNNYTPISYSETATPAELELTKQTVVTFNPHIIIGSGFTEFGDVVLPSIDRAMTAGGGKGPSWFITATNLSAGLFTEGSMRPELQSRVVWPGPDFAAPNTVTKLVDFKAEFPTFPPLDPVLGGYLMMTYDLVYLYAYAVTANGTNPITGDNIAKALPKIFAPGATEILTGREDLFRAFTAIGPGGNGSIFLKGRQIFRHDDKMDFDLNLGKQPYWPFSLYCPMNNELNIVKDAPPFAWISAMPAGFTYTFPQYTAVEGTFNEACAKYANFGADAGADGGQ